MNNHVTAKFRDGNHDINISLALYIWEENNVTFIYSPALDLTGYGDSEGAARESFETTLSEFVEYTRHKNTIFAELEHLGWLVNKKKKRVSAPMEADLLKDNSTFKNIMQNKGVRHEMKDTQLVVS